MAGHEDGAEESVTGVGVVDRAVHVAPALSTLDIASDFFVLALERLAAADHIDRAMLRGPHQPGARSFWNARHRPLLERRHQGILRELLGRSDVVDDANQPGDEPG